MNTPQPRCVIKPPITDIYSEAPHHLPSGRFAANAAWLACATVAHNLYRWLAHLTKVRHNNKLTVGQTVRNHLLALPGRLVNHAGRTVLRLPARWPWAALFHTTLTNIRALPQLC